MHITLVNNWMVLLICILMVDQVRVAAWSNLVGKGDENSRQEGQHGLGSRQHIRISGHQTFGQTQMECTSLSKFITCFEEIEFDLSLESSPRSSFYEYDFIWSNKAIVELDFDAFNTSFHLKLFPSPREGIVAETLNLTVISSTDKVLRRRHSSEVQYYHGYLPRASAASHGTFLYNAVFDGVFHTAAGGSFYMEPASRYFPAHTTKTGRPTAVVYKSTDLRFDKTTSPKMLGLSVSNGRVFHDTSILSRSFRHSLPRSHQRHKRTLSKEMKICELHTVSDHTFFQRVARSSISQTITEIVYYITEVDEIFRTTDFDGDGQGDNIGFMVTDVTVYQSSTAKDYKISDQDLAVDAVLTKFSSYEFNDVCLALLLTYRDFDDGIVGLAWVATSSLYGSPTGICQKRTHANQKLAKGFYNFNTALVSMLNFGSMVPREVGALIVAHELGHNFGSKHDKTEDAKCTPGGRQGHYIMYPYSTGGDKPNNDKFSSCSILYMWPVIKNKGSCFKRRNGPVCGNKRVEEGEECDCGYASLCQQDPCCAPPSVSEDGTGCLLKDGKACFTDSPCCTNTCELVSTPNICRAATQCSMASVCSGSSAECPEAQHQPDGTECSNEVGKGTCSQGRCIVAFCEELGLKECQCSSQYFMDTKVCEICCQCSVGSNFACVPLSVLGVYHEDGSIIYQSTGQPCDTYSGYCGADHHCETMGYTGAIDRLNNVFRKSSQHAIQRWIQNHWYYFVITAAAISLIVAVVKRYWNWKKAPSALAYRTGKMAVLWQRAEHELQQVERQLAELWDIGSTKLSEMDGTKQQPMDRVVALARMTTFFPSVPRATIASVVWSSATEESAVRQLLLRGYPITKLVEKEVQQVAIQ